MSSINDLTHCPTCRGSGTQEVYVDHYSDDHEHRYERTTTEVEPCAICGGDGYYSTGGAE